MKIYTVDTIRKAEQDANLSGFSYYDMMKQAGTNTANEICARYDIVSISECPITIICGKGRNGGDGFVIANQLAKHGAKVSLILPYGQPTDEVCIQVFDELDSSIYICTEDEYEEYIEKSLFLIDAVFGIGFHGKLDEKIKKIFEYCNINRENQIRISIDIESGVEADSRKYADGYFNSHHIFTMIGLKPCLVEKNATVINIGITPEKVDYFVADEEYIRNNLPVRPAESHKGTFGTVLSVCGSYEMPGAAILCANAAVHSGCGLVVCAFPKEAYNVIAGKLTEPILLPLGDNAYENIEALVEKSKNAKVLVLGCGLGVSEYAKILVCGLIRKAHCPVVLDADGLNNIANIPHILSESKHGILITPHPAEMSRLSGVPVQDIQLDRMNVALNFARKYSVTVLLKGHKTIIASPNSNLYMNFTGSSALAKGGSGDVLAGVIAALVAQGLNLVNAAVVGAYIHGKAGEKAEKEYSAYSATPSRVIELLFS
jgi:NAD(P)H-hydrate epimerase